MAWSVKGLLLGLGVLCSVVSTRGFAWGERGHHLIAVDAARLIEQQQGQDQAFSQVLLNKEHMLGHLANVPDIVWRNGDKSTIESNAPTHHFDLQFVTLDAKLDAMPRTYETMVTMVRARCKATPSEAMCRDLETQGGMVAAKAGTAPFRVQQLQQLMAQAFGRAAHAEGKAFNDAVDEALLYGGICAHFVGDLAQPLHATSDYDGWGTGQGGLHWYFESDIVNAQDLNLEPEVARLAASDPAPLQRLLQSLPAQERDDPKQLPLGLAYALMLDSFHHIKALDELDRKYSLQHASSSERGMKIPATRQPAAKEAAAYRAFTVQRLALASQTLAYLWTAAWKQGGSPNLAAYKSFAYPVAPAYILPNYIVAAP